MCAKIPGSSVRDFYHNLDNNQGKEVILKAENNKILKEKKNWILLLFKKLAKLIFNRIFYVAVAMLVQLGWILMMVLRLAAYSRYIDIGLRLIGIVLVLWILNKEINPSYKLAWTMLILILPILGVVLYFVFGRSRIAAIMQQHFEQRIEESREYLRDRPQTRQKLEALDPSASNQSRYISDVSRFPVHENTTAEYFQVGDDMFPVLVRELKQAKKYIFIEYFIINDGVMWQTILNILEEKAAEGVDVRLIYDGFGCLTTLPHKYYEELQKKGIKCQVFNPFRPILNIIQNNRDHRKITVIDGKVAYTGGMNLADEYINARVRFGYWKDAAIRLTGECVWSFTSMFLELWDYILKTESDYTFYRATSMEKHRLQEKIHADEKGFVQPYTDSPLDHEDVGENVYLNIISRAKKYLYIFTPYLIIGSEMRTALVNAAKSGVDVRLVVPGIPDKKLVYFLTQSNFPYLIKNGVKIYTYTPGFIHAKCFVSDAVQATVGTVNMDYRSLCLHFECGVWMYRTRAVLQVKEDALKTFAESHEVTLEEFQKKSFLVRTFMGALKLFAPLL